MYSSLTHFFLYTVAAILVMDFFTAVSVFQTINYRGRCTSTEKTDDKTSSDSKRSIKPREISLWHAILFIGQKWNYYIQILVLVQTKIKVKLCGGRDPTHDDVCHFVLNTSLCAFASVTRKSYYHNKSCSSLEVLSVCIEDDSIPLVVNPGRKDNSFKITVEIPIQKDGSSGDDEPHCLTTFDVNGKPVKDAGDQMALCGILVSTVYHPQIHSFFGELYKQRHLDNNNMMYDNLFLHGQYLNEVAHTMPSKLLRVPEQLLERSLSVCSERSVNFHGPNLVPLAKYSRFVHFMLQARLALFQLCKKHRVPFDPEYIFLCSILHSVDHYSTGSIMTKLNIQGNKFSPKSWYNALHVMFYLPSQYICTNLLRFKTHKTPFYQDLYMKLREIDEEYADVVTLSISY